MSELSDRISAAIARNTDAEASMLHAFDIPLNRKDFRYVAHICSGELKEKRLLDQWNNLIVDSTNGFDVAYYDTYAKNCS